MSIFVSTKQTNNTNFTAMTNANKITTQAQTILELAEKHGYYKQGFDSEIALVVEWGAEYVTVTILNNDENFARSKELIKSAVANLAALYPTLTKLIEEGLEMIAKHDSEKASQKDAESSPSLDLEAIAEGLSGSGGAITIQGQSETFTIPESPEKEANENRLEAGEDGCVCCGRKVNPNTAKWVHMSTAWKAVPRGTELPAEDCQGWFPVGPSCAKNIPAQFLYPTGHIR